MDLQDVFVQNLKFFRKKKNLTQNELTLAIDKSYNYINGIEQKKYFPNPATIQKIAEILEIKPMQLFDENGCLENALKNNRENFTDEIIEKLHALLREDIKTEIQKVLG
jgi:transcriptional regulator with XRE-family HTH domain